MGEETTRVRFGLNGSVRVAARGEQLSRVGGAALLREVDDALAITAGLAAVLEDPRNHAQVRYSLSEVLRTRLRLIALGCRDQGDADLSRNDSALRLAVSDSAGLTPLLDSALASQPTMLRLIDTLALPHNLAHSNHALLTSALRCGRAGCGVARQRATLDSGHWLGVELRPGNGHTARGVMDFLQPIISEVATATGHQPRIRGDSDFVNAATLDQLQRVGVEYVFRVNYNRALQKLARRFLRCPPGPQPALPREWVHEVEYRAKSWNRPRHVVIVVMERKDERFLQPFVLVTNASKHDWPAERLLADYRQRGTMEARIGELPSVIAPALSCTQRGADRTARDPHDVVFRNATTLTLFALAYNLAHSARLHYVRATKQPCVLDTLRKRLLAVLALVVTSARRATFCVTATVAQLWARFLRGLAAPRTA